MGNQANVQTPNNFSQFSSNAARLLAGDLNINSLRTNRLLRKDEWVQLDTRIVNVARERLIGIQDLRSRGLTHQLGGLGTLYSQYEQQGDMSDANVDMGGVTQGEEDDIGFNPVTVPVPIVHKDFSINLRRLQASRKLGDGLDTTTGEVASRKVSEGIENMLFKGANLTVDGNKIYGYTSHPNRVTGTTSGSWSTIGNVYNDVLDMIKEAHGKNKFGPFILYVAGDVWPSLLDVYTDGSGQTARDRIINGIPELQDIKPADKLDSGNVVLVQMTSDNVDLAVAQDINTVEWNEQGGMVTNFKVMAAMVPRIKADSEGRLGVVHITGA